MNWKPQNRCKDCGYGTNRNCGELMFCLEKDKYVKPLSTCEEYKPLSSQSKEITMKNKHKMGGGIVVDGACVVNGVAVAGGTYTSIVSSGGSAVVNE